MKQGLNLEEWKRRCRLAVILPVSQVRVTSVFSGIPSVAGPEVINE